MSDLTDREQRSVRTTPLFLRVRAGCSWEPVAKALHVDFVDEASGGAAFAESASRRLVRDDRLLSTSTATCLTWPNASIGTRSARMSKIETYTKQNRMPFVYSDKPNPPPTEEPIVKVGDHVITNGPWVEPQKATVLDVSSDHGTVWVDVPGPGGDRTAIGVHRIESIRRGADRWTRSYPKTAKQLNAEIASILQGKIK